MGLENHSALKANAMDSATTPASLSYAAAGVDNLASDAGLAALLPWVRKTHSFRPGTALDIGYFANVVDVGNGVGIAISTDTTGTKVLVAQMVGQYETVGIDCVAINVNDIVSVGAEPVAFVDCISVERVSGEVLDQIGKGLHAGAELAHVPIVGGEIAQVAEIVKGHRPGLGFDLAGTCIGTVPTDRIIAGDAIGDGDVLIGLRSSGIHCNGLTLARRALFDEAGHTPDTVLPELGRSLGAELLEPTRIYVDEVMALLRHGVRVKALAHITGNGGLLNATRTRTAAGYVVERLPEPPPIFGAIQQAGNVVDEEMFRVYNMGVGFTVVVDPGDVDRTLKITRSYGAEAYVLGYAVPDARRRVNLEPVGLVGEAGRFRRAA